MFEIPGYPTICRVCLAKTGAADSVPLEMTVRDGADSYGTILDRVLSQQRTDQNIDHSQLPTHICSTCRHRLDEFNAFQLEIVANELLMNAWIQFDRSADINPLSELCHPQGVHQVAVKNTLNRLGVLEGRSLDDLLKDLAHSEIEQIKEEIEIHESVIEPAQDDEMPEEPSQDNVPTNGSDSEDDQAVDIPKKKSQRRSECSFETCAPLVPRQKMGQHVRESHRAYCKLCGLVFQKTAHVMNHMSIHKSDELRHRCELCDRPFWREKDLNLHLKEFHGMAVDARECPYCEERFQTVAQMIDHREVHKSCKFCEKEFVSYKIVLKHMRAAHVDRLHSCKLCSVNFLGKQEYETHLRKHREGARENSVPFTMHGWTGAECMTCERMYFSEQYLTDHFQNDHTNGIEQKPKRTIFYNKRPQEKLNQLEYKFKCKDCPATFRFKASLKGHLQKFHNGVKFICEHCGASFNTKPALKSHEMYRHTNETAFQCEFCVKRCHTKFDLAVHRRTHTNEKPFSCSYGSCDKSYKTQSALVKHIRYHTGERPYRCTYEGCEKAYACSQLLKAHVRSHTLETPYKCWYCEHHFNTNNNRVKHCKRHHVGRPFGREFERIAREQQRLEQIQKLEN
uniref:Zinc finger protein 197 n=1 Tax=Culex pipiens TaxID=7175 RepID=A0A8D8KUJ2_CULPI